MRNFEKISYEEFCKSVSNNNRELYDSIQIPKRSTINSCGYDIMSVSSGIIMPHQSMIFKTGIKVRMNSDEMLYIYSRSGQGFKNDVSLSNSVGLIDADYYNNPSNEGHIMIKLINHGESKYTVNIGDRIAQGVFMKYLTVDNEDEITNSRNGGFGSTNGDDKNG